MGCIRGTYLVLYKDLSSIPLSHQRVCLGEKQLDERMSEILNGLDSNHYLEKEGWFIYEVGCNHPPKLRQDLRKKYGLIPMQKRKKRRGLRRNGWFL